MFCLTHRHDRGLRDEDGTMGLQKKEVTACRKKGAIPNLRTKVVKPMKLLQQREAVPRSSEETDYLIVYPSPTSVREFGW